MDITVDSEKTIDALNELLRGEISAVETYGQALDAVDGQLSARTDLEECRASHAQRVSRLQQAVRQLGGEPAVASGVWGAFAKAVEGGAKAMGSRMAIAALEEGEDHGVKEYQQALEKLDLPSRQLISRELLPEQMRTHGTLSSLKRTLAA